MKRSLSRYLNFPREALIWVVGLLLLFVLDPEGAHFSICPLHQFGFEFCPGCGLGKSIGYLFRGDFSKSFHTHPLGIFAFVVLSARIFSLTKQHFQYHGQNH